MSQSVTSREREYRLRGDRSVASSLSSASGRRKSNRFTGDRSTSDSAVFLPSSLRVPAVDCDKSLQELDETVASISKLHSSDSALDNGERSPTSVSHDITGNGNRPMATEEVLLHLSQSIPLDFRRVESGSGRSNISRSSRRSMSLGGPDRSNKATRKKRKDNLEQRICQTILSTASEHPTSNCTKDTNESPSRSAQFILTDLFHEASKSMDESALPQPPFGDGTSWSQIACQEDLQAEKPASQVLRLSVRPSSRKISDDALLISSDFQVESSHAIDTTSPVSAVCAESPAVENCVPKDDLANDDLFTDLDPFPESRRLGDIIKEAETESDFSPFYDFDTQEEQATNFTLRRDNTFNAATEFTGTLEYSMDESQLQYSLTNGTSTFSHCSQAPDRSLSRPSDEQRAAGEDQVADDWTVFDESIFKKTNANDDFGFGAFSPFEDDGDDGEWSSPQSKPDPPADIDPAWDPSRAPLRTSSPNSPASVFQFVSNDEEDVVAADSKSDTLWNISDIDFQGF